MTEDDLRRELGTKFHNLSNADRDRMVKMMFAMLSIQQRPVQELLERMTGMLSQALAKEGPQVVERIVQVQGQTQPVASPIELSPELVAKLLEGDVKTNLDETEISTGNSNPVDDAVARLKNLLGKKPSEGAK